MSLGRPALALRISYKFITGSSCIPLQLANKQSVFPSPNFRSFANSAVLQEEDVNAVRILEVGPRDGLQNIKKPIATPIKVQLIQRLAAAGLRNIEATSFVSPKWVPQLADGADVMHQLSNIAWQHQMKFPVLAPNLKGLQNATKSKAEEVVVFASATEAFSKKNQNCTVDEALAAAEDVVENALKQNIAVRGVISCVFADPYSGPTSPPQVLRVAKRFLAMGCYEVGLGDTTGVGTPKDTQALLEILLKEIPAERIAGHFHDTYGQGVANVHKAYEMGVRKFDSSIAGLGGCPYAKGAKGNVATEDIVYAFEKSGIETGVDLEALVAVGEWISHEIGQPYESRAGAALAAKRKSITQASMPSKIQPTRIWTLVQDSGEYQVSRSANVLKVTLTRPRNGNALTNAMVDGLTKLFTETSHDRSIFHVIIEAEGRFFCTGMDLSGGTNTADMLEESSYYSKVKGLYTALDNMPQTTIAAVNGPCYGGGVGLAFVCDVRLVSSQASWTLSEVHLGLAPAIISKYMVREWGVAFSREAILSGRKVLPAELQQIGAIHGICDNADQLHAKVETYLDSLKRCAPNAAATCKKLVILGWSDAGGMEQEAKIKMTFGKMMAPGSEGSFGIKQFQNKEKVTDWGSFWSRNDASAKPSVN